MLPILPHDGAENFFGPLDASPGLFVAYADNHTIDDLKAPRYTDNSALPPDGSGATLPSSISPLTILFPS